MARIVVIEDEADIREVLQYSLAQAGHQVTVCATGQEGLRVVRETLPDVLLLDLMLPDLHGTEICKALRQAPETRDLRIVMVTAKAEEIDRVVGFEIGADDYVTKPFSVRELLLRVQALLRRPAGDAAGRVIRFGDLRVDRDAHRVWVGGEEIDLTALEFQLLVALHDRQNRVQSRAALLATVWGIHSDIETRTVDTHVKRLREKLGPASRYIETVRGVGYRFTDDPSTEPRA